jgi:hypothetical protein
MTFETPPFADDNGQTHSTRARLSASATVWTWYPMTVYARERPRIRVSRLAD